MTKYQVNVAGESFAAILFSQGGYDISIQFGTTQPYWDLIATKRTRTLKISVKGSQDGGWGMFQRFKKRGNTFDQAVAAWAAAQPSDLVYLFVQFKGVPVGSAPRAYIARPQEIVTHMATTRGGNGETCLHEHHRYMRGCGAGHCDMVPPYWQVTQNRLDTV